jgi:hypothetical protein
MWCYGLIHENGMHSKFIPEAIYLEASVFSLIHSNPVMQTPYWSNFHLRQVLHGFRLVRLSMAGNAGHPIPVFDRR